MYFPLKAVVCGASHNVILQTVSVFQTLSDAHKRWCAKANKPKKHNKLLENHLHVFAFQINRLASIPMDTVVFKNRVC